MAIGRYPTFMECAARHAATEIGRSSSRDRPPETGGERLRELRRPGHDLEDHLGQVDARQHRRGTAAQVNQRRRLLDGLDPGQVDLPGVVDADLGVGGQPPADFPVGGVQRPGVPGQQRVRVVGQAEGGQHVGADRRPRPAFQEPGLRVAPPGRGVGADLAALEAPPELLQHAEGVGVPAHRAARRVPGARTPAASTGRSPRLRRSGGRGSAARAGGCGRPARRAAPASPPAPARPRRSPRTRSPTAAASRTPTPSGSGPAARPASRPGPPRPGGGTLSLTSASAARSSARETTASIASHTCDTRGSSSGPPQPSDSNSASTATASRAEALASLGCLRTFSLSAARLRLVQQLGRHQQVQQLQGVIDRLGLQEPDRGQQRRQPAAVRMATDQRGVRAHPVPGQLAQPARRHQRLGAQLRRAPGH